ncbi:MAG: single-stranded DNA-binding protein [Lachnospirales bacterium]
MNKVMLMGRLTRDPDVRYSQSATPVAIARYSLAVNRRFKREGEPEADFINCVAFGKTGEFAEKYLKKGQLINVVGSLRTGSYDDKDGKRVYTTDVVVDEHYFAESKKSFESSSYSGDSAPTKSTKPSKPTVADDFKQSNDETDDDLPF